MKPSSDIDTSMTTLTRDDPTIVVEVWLLQAEDGDEPGAVLSFLARVAGKATRAYRGLNVTAD